MIMGLNLSDKHSGDSATNSKSRVCLQRHTFFNQIIRKLFKKFVSKSQRDWDDKLGECLRAYHTTVRTLTKALSFSLVYGYEVVLPLEIQIPLLRIILTTKMTRWGEASTATPEAGSFGRQMLASPIANRALSSSNFQSVQQESQGADFQERRPRPGCQKTHGDDT